MLPFNVLIQVYVFVTSHIFTLISEELDTNNNPLLSKHNPVIGPESVCEYYIYKYIYRERNIILIYIKIDR